MSEPTGHESAPRADTPRARSSGPIDGALHERAPTPASSGWPAPAARDAEPRTRPGAVAAGEPIKVLYLFTSFPVLSETFLQREVRVLRELPVDLTVYSLWGGRRDFEGQAINRFAQWRLITLLWRLPVWVARRPGVFRRLVARLAARHPGSGKDFWGTLLAINFALCHAHRFAREPDRPHLIHAGWAAIPATAAMLLSELIDVPFSMQAQAFDIFRHGGDWLLPSKLREAALVITSTEYARRRLIELGVEPHRLVMIRRGLDRFPGEKPPRLRREPLRLLSVGRLIEKKGYVDQLELLGALKRSGLRFEAHIIGGGELEPLIRSKLLSLNLLDSVKLLRVRSNDFVLRQMQWADVFLFTGKVASTGDRDGLPNVIAEAMAVGLPVVSTDVAGVPEAIDDGVTGTLIRGMAPDLWRAALLRLRDDDEYYMRIRRGARAWVEREFDAGKNVRRIHERLHALVEATRARPVVAGADATVTRGDGATGDEGGGQWGRWHPPAS